MAEGLTKSERRVVGVLIEKGFTTPEQYPLSLNSLVAGCNQKSCREPLMSLDEEGVMNALDSLRQKGWATLVRAGGSRVDKFRHHGGDVLGVEAKELAIVAELLLRGPQTDGELRQRASRMRPLDSLEEVREFIEGLVTRDQPLIVRLGPPGRRRGVKYAHTLYSERELEAIQAQAASEASTSQAADSPGTAPSSAPADPGRSGLAGTVARLENEVQALRDRLEQLEARLDPS